MRWKKNLLCGAAAVRQRCSVCGGADFCYRSIRGSCRIRVKRSYQDKNNVCVLHFSGHRGRAATAPLIRNRGTAVVKFQENKTIRNLNLVWRCCSACRTNYKTKRRRPTKSTFTSHARTHAHTHARTHTHTHTHTHWHTSTHTHLHARIHTLTHTHTSARDAHTHTRARVHTRAICNPQSHFPDMFLSIFLSMRVLYNKLWPAQWREFYHLRGIIGIIEQSTLIT